MFQLRERESRRSLELTNVPVLARNNGMSRLEKWCWSGKRWCFSCNKQAPFQWWGGPNSAQRAPPFAPPIGSSEFGTIFHRVMRAKLPTHKCMCGRKTTPPLAAPLSSTRDRMRHMKILTHPLANTAMRTRPPARLPQQSRSSRRFSLQDPLASRMEILNRALQTASHTHFPLARFDRPPSSLSITGTFSLVSLQFNKLQPLAADQPLAYVLVYKLDACQLVSFSDIQKLVV